MRHGKAVVRPRPRKALPIHRKHTVKVAPVKVAPVKVPVQVPEPLQATLAAQRKVVLVYPGDHTAFLLREFSSIESAARFIAANQFRTGEFAIVLGTVKRCDPRYRSDKASYRVPAWDDGSDDDEVVIPTSNEIPLNSAALELSDVYSLLQGR